MNLNEQITTDYFWNYAVYQEILLEVLRKVPNQSDSNFLTTDGPNVNTQSLVTTIERMATRSTLSPSALAYHLANFYSLKFGLPSKVPTVFFKNQSAAILRLRQDLVSRLGQFNYYRDRVLSLLKKQRPRLLFEGQTEDTLLRLMGLIVVYFVAPFSKPIPEAITFDMFKRFIGRYGPLSICMTNILSNFFSISSDTLWNLPLVERSTSFLPPYLRPTSVSPTKTKEIIQNFRKLQQEQQRQFRRSRDQLPFYLQYLSDDSLLVRPVFLIAPIENKNVYEYALFRESTQKDGTVDISPTIKTDIIQFVLKKERDGFVSNWEYTISFSDDGKQSMGHGVSPFVADEQAQGTLQYVWSPSFYKARGLSKQQAKLEAYRVLPDIDRVFMPNLQQTTQSHSVPSRTYRSVWFEEEMQRHDLCANQFHFFFS